ncbi:MAG: hypothetical protein COY66_02180 [Candidatus Kerfeldbacteria bacterium CG_4_10_14_0_8_um_filter_42_10]|uniref:Uncharacterized protein n=1 Tax=Candidatus Kerfeldbacteria bacterium CG_4_10_14_0_8_um_filter_42_10 TaxID=2014248 RepID=A0A2M7RK98_9BACT|nr:MAG: hypothetical protein COY66_02180 [Candidatus Kerfeldbacteria bacterium CG_4_10_14_0_8_um_filter_42_10]
MNDVRVSSEMKNRAHQAFQTHQVEKSTDLFEVFKMPQGELDHMSLILFKTGHDIDPERLNGNLFFPVEIEGRKGYVLATEEAMAYGF